MTKKVSQPSRLELHLVKGFLKVLFVTGTALVGGVWWFGTKDGVW